MATITEFRVEVDDEPYIDDDGTERRGWPVLRAQAKVDGVSIRTVIPMYVNDARTVEAATAIAREEMHRAAEVAADDSLR
jgi:hypothetical protein